LAEITGSASGGVSIALQTMGSTYLELGQAAGIHPDLFASDNRHRDQWARLTATQWRGDHVAR